MQHSEGWNLLDLLRSSSARGLPSECHFLQHWGLRPLAKISARMPQKGSWGMGWTDGALVGLGFAASSRNPALSRAGSREPEEVACPFPGHYTTLIGAESILLRPKPQAGDTASQLDSHGKCRVKHKLVLQTVFPSSPSLLASGLFILS